MLDKAKRKRHDRARDKAEVERKRGKTSSEGRDDNIKRIVWYLPRLG